MKRHKILNIFADLNWFHMASDFKREFHDNIGKTIELLIRARDRNF